MKLRPYQGIARSFMRDVPRCALWAGMGMGKTTSTLHTVVDLMLLGDVDRVLVIAPLRVARDVWTDEAMKWPALRHLRISPIVGTIAQRRAALRRPADVYTINFENVPWLIEVLGEIWPFDTVIVDEASKLRGFRLQGGGTARARALSGFAHTKIRRFVELTGTPAANSLTALWGQAWFLDGGERLGRSFDAFQKRWFQSFGEPGKALLTPLPFAFEQITEAMADICLTLRAKDWFDLREPIRNRVVVKLPPPVRKIYKQFERELYAQLEHGEVKAFNAAAKSMKTLQIANGAVFTDPKATQWEEVHREKLDALEEIVDEATDSAVIGVYQFVPDKLRMLKRFGKNAVDLSTAAGLAAFKAGGAKLGIAHPQSLGHGVDGLQNVCNQIAFLGHWWNLEDRLQIIDRVGPTRQAQAGFDRPLWIHDIVAEGTIDEVVMARHETKRDVQDLLLEAMTRGGA